MRSGVRGPHATGLLVCGCAHSGCVICLQPNGTGDWNDVCEEIEKEIECSTRGTVQGRLKKTADPTEKEAYSQEDAEYHDSRDNATRCFAADAHLERSQEKHHIHAKKD